MPLQNRVTPEGEIIATTARGMMMGNRGGSIHRGDQTLSTRRWVSKRWIACRLEFKARHREVMAPRRYTELFFLDEATALAAGHRPCFECRRADAKRFASLWGHIAGLDRPPSANEMDAVLHAQRIVASGAKATHRLPADRLPTGAIIRWQGRPWLVSGGKFRLWTPYGYEHAAEEGPRAGQDVDVLTPAVIVSVLGARYTPGLHASAGENVSWKGR